MAKQKEDQSFLDDPEFWKEVDEEVMKFVEAEEGEVDEEDE